eukprot:GDKK01015221.1.p2 GENE.GDKK01015221.1~~GDKK01015221.1.p2  ORF type:complete len:132 (-),score=35.33 GDKK01015221.1:101-496(-)
MFRNLVLSAITVFAYCDSNPTAISAGRGELVARGDFLINVHPPQEDDADIIESIDMLGRVEESIRRAEEEDFAVEKERLLNTLRDNLNNVVNVAFEPIQALIPNPIHTQVRRALVRYTFPQRDESLRKVVK